MADWAQDFLDIWGEPSPILSAGGYAAPFEIEPDGPSIPCLITEAYNASVKAGTKVYCGHLYASTNSTSLAAEMNHKGTVVDLSHFEEHVALSAAEERPYNLGMSRTWQGPAPKTTGSPYLTRTTTRTHTLNILGTLAD